MTRNHELATQNSDRGAPLGDAALALLVEQPGGERQLIDESILDGEGVSTVFISGCRQAADRLKGYPSILDYHTFPRNRDGPTYLFFEGEDFQYEHKGGANSVNNPMQIIRPKVLSSPSTMVYDGIGATSLYPANYAKDRSERGYYDQQMESLYAKGVTQYEDLFITVLETTNLASEENRAQHVREKLAEIFGNGAETKPARIRYSEVSDLRTETPAGWLTHAVLAVLLHSSDQITPAARVRALGLLKLFPSSELSDGFGGGTKSGHSSSFHGSGLMPAGIKARLPHTLTGQDERHLAEHKGWEKNPQISPIVGYIMAGDFRSATSEVVRRPHEAVQIALLTLFIYGKQEFGLGVLRTIPDLDRKTQALMFGNRATYYVDNTISNNLEDQIAEGAGTRFDPTSSFDGLTAEMLESSSPDELKRLLASAVLQLRAAEELAADMAEKSRTEPEAEGRSDPDGLCSVLGINPNILEAYGPEELDIIIRGAARTMSKLTHPDKGDESDAADRDTLQKQVNNARDRLLDHAFRRTYGT